MFSSFPVSILFQLSLFNFKSFTCCSLEDDALKHLKQVKEMFEEVETDPSHIKDKKYLSEYCDCVVKDYLSEFCINILKQDHTQEKVSRTQDQSPLVQFILDVSIFFEPKTVFLLPQRGTQDTLQLIKNLSTYNMSLLFPEKSFPFISSDNDEVHHDIVSKSKHLIHPNSLQELLSTNFLLDEGAINDLKVLLITQLFYKSSFIFILRL